MGAQSKHLDNLQNQLRILLNHFLNNTCITRASFFTNQKTSKYAVHCFLQSLNREVEAFAQEETISDHRPIHFLQKNGGLFEKNVISKKEFSQLLASGYESLDSIIESSAVGPAIVKTVEGFLPFEDWLKKARSVDADTAHKISRFREYLLKNKLDEEIVGFYIHGSYSSLDFVKGYSDLDTLCILKKDTAASVEKLVQFRDRIVPALTFLYLTDPLQHHGFSFITEIDLKYYPQAYFPLLLFDTSTSLFSQKKLPVCLRDDLRERSEIWDMFGRFLQKKNLRTVYSIKHYIQSVLLLPALYLQLKNDEYYYKKITFDLIKEEFPATDLSAIEYGTNFRNYYKHKTIYPFAVRKYLGLSLNSRLLHLLHRFTENYQIQKARRLLGTNIYSEATRLFAKMDDKLRELKHYQNA
jgi:predicted nucleotidyltransferase